MKFRTLSIALLAASFTLAAPSRAADTPAEKPPAGDAPKIEKAPADTGAPKVQKAPGDTAAPNPNKKGAAKLDGNIAELDLTDAQRTDIAKLRSDLKAEIKALMEAERTKESALLTPDQKAQLTALDEADQKAVAEAKAAKAAKKAAKDTPKDPTKITPKDNVKTPKAEAAPAVKLP